jgi:hypothetical protein
LSAIRDLIAAGSVAQSTLVFGPGLSQWMPAAQVPALAAGGVVATADPAALGASMLPYRGVETSTHGLSDVAIRALQQTKPWVRFIGIMTFIGAGFMVLGGIGMLIAGAFAARGGPSSVIPVWLGAVYIVMAFVYIIPGILLNRYASGIANLMRSQRMSDVEHALTAQKSFWRFSGIALIVVMCLYFVFIAIMVVTKGRF